MALALASAPVREGVTSVTDVRVVVERDPGAGLGHRPRRAKGSGVMSGPFSHLAAERERLSGLRWQYFDATPLGVTVGAEITGVDLRRPLAAAVVAELRRALFDYKVLFFRNQPLSPAEHVAFARRFGPLELHPFIPSNTAEPELVRFEKGAEVAGYENSWHHDVTWRLRPSMAAVLHALTVPPRGGDTLFADMYAAYDSLDDATCAVIEDLDALHDFTRAFGHAVPAGELAAMQQRYPAVSHPVVCTHPATGRRHLYVNRIFVRHLIGLDRDESLALLDRLCRQADSPEHQYRFTWSDHAVAMWDNRAVQHYASSDYWPHTRIMERASIAGDRPARHPGTATISAR
jgi:taurine dioxygenase